MYRLGSLPVAGTLDAPAAAVELFVARARAADPRLQLTAANVSAIAEICRRLDGMPLAIELAAARVAITRHRGTARAARRALSGPDGRHSRSSAPPSDAARRARMELWTAFADEQAVFRRLGVFVGGFTLELAQDVAADDQIDRWAVLDLLGHLVDNRWWSPTATTCRATGCSKPCARLRWRSSRQPARRQPLKRHAEAMLDASAAARRAAMESGPADRSGSARNWTTCAPRSAGPSPQQAIGRLPAP